MSATTLILKNTQIPQVAGSDEKRKNDRKRMAVLIYSVIKSSANGVSIRSATNAVENQ